MEVSDHPSVGRGGTVFEKYRCRENGGIGSEKFRLGDIGAGKGYPVENRIITSTIQHGNRTKLGRTEFRGFLAATPSIDV